MDDPEKYLVDIYHREEPKNMSLIDIASEIRSIGERLGYDDCIRDYFDLGPLEDSILLRKQDCDLGRLERLNGELKRRENYKDSQ